MYLYYYFNMKKDIQEDIFSHYGHHKSRTHYHLILVTKYRRQCLDYIRDTVFEAFRYAEQKSDFRIKSMNIDKDHIHLLVSISTRYSIEQVIRRIKQLTTNYIYYNCNTYMNRFFWKKKRVLWSSSYFISSVGSISEHTVKEYIDNQ